LQIFEIELLRWESVNDLSPEKDGSLMKRTLQEGDLNVWDKPKEADLVVVSYTACVEGESMPFAEGKGAEFRVADGHFCPAIKEAVLTMKEGERVELKVPSSPTSVRGIDKQICHGARTSGPQDHTPYATPIDTHAYICCTSVHCLSGGRRAKGSLHVSQAFTLDRASVACIHKAWNGGAF
jgi:hypothetical protein